VWKLVSYVWSELIIFVICQEGCRNTGRITCSKMKNLSLWFQANKEQTCVETVSYVWSELIILLIISCWSWLTELGDTVINCNPDGHLKV
jgi:hypothetical protein